MSQEESNKNNISNRYIKCNENDEIIRKSYSSFKEDDEEENKMISNMDCPFPQAF